MIDSVVKYITGRVRLIGNTDGTLIGNSDDRLKVDTGHPFNSKSRVEYLRTPVSITSNSSYASIYNYTGTGYIIGFSLEYNNVNVVPRLKVDGETIFDGISISDLNGFASTASTNDRRQNGQGVVTASSTFDFSFRDPIYFGTSWAIDTRLDTSGILTRTFNQGIIYSIKLT